MQTDFVKCCHCSEVLERFGDRCPTCGKNPKRDWLSVVGWLLAIAATFAIGIAIVFYVRRTADEIQAERATRPRMLAEVRANASVLEIINLNEEAWTNVKLTVNDSYTFRFKLGIVDKGRVSTFALVQFVASDGERFDPLRYAVNSVDITAKYGEKGDGQTIEGHYKF